MWKAEGFDDCVIGTVLVPGESRRRILYDAEMCIESIQDRSGGDCTYDEAEEYFEYNVLGSMLKDGPAYVWTMSIETIEAIEGFDRGISEDMAEGPAWPDPSGKTDVN
tara:strand:+ start:649 stop:972 length:324 start_codon:yes stop_codon:yes gene_type:complete